MTTEPESPELFTDLAAPAAPADPRRRGAAPRLSAAHWRTLLDCAETAQTYTASVYQRAPGACWPWLGAISASGHGKLKAGRAAAARGAVRTVTAHVYGYQHHHGVILAELDIPDPVIAHTCDDHACQNPAHWQITSRAENLSDYYRRRHAWPLCDTRGAAGRATAIRDAVRAALAHGQDPETAWHTASEAGRPPRGPEQLPLL